MATLMSSNDFLISRTHSIFSPFLGKSLRGCTISTNPLIKFHIKSIFQKKYLISLWLCGGEKFRMASILLGSMEILALEIIWPSSFPLVTPNEYFLGLSDMPYFQHLLNTYLKSTMWVLWFFENIVKSSI